EEITADLQRILGDVRFAVEDWEAMRDRAETIAAALDTDAAPIDAEERAETAKLLRWLRDKHFVFLGFREYEIVPENGDDVLRAVAGSGLGILRETNGRPAAHSYSKLPPDVRAKAREKSLLNLTKANSRSTVHRSNYLDYVGVKRFDDKGEVVAERRFLGLYTSRVYKQWPEEIPFVRRAAKAVIDRAGLADDSFSGKALREIIDEYPRDELFQMNADELYESVMSILALQDRQRLRLLVRRDEFGRFFSCLVFLPRSRVTPQLEQRIGQALRRAFGGMHLEQSTAMSGSVLARLHLVIYTTPGAEPDYDVAELEAELSEAMRSWTEDLRDALLDDMGEERGLELYRKYGQAFGTAYVGEVTARAAVSDIRHFEALGETDGFAVNLYKPVEASDGALRLKVFRRGQPITLSAALPTLENMGVQVVDERPYDVWPVDEEPIWVYDFGLDIGGELDLDAGDVRDRFHEAFTDVWKGTADNDAFNRLVVRAGLRSRDVLVLRAYAKYLRQAGGTFGAEYVAAALVGNPGLARILVELFNTMFDPDRPEEDRPGHDRLTAAKDLTAEFERGLDAVVNLNEDRVLRRLLGTMQATVRTNFFQHGDDGAPAKPWLSFKLDSRLVPDLPLPRPLYETFVTSPRMEGIHLRGGKVARGGIRWSDRHEDFRTEILGLMKAQNVKNAVIVPVGAKGGFVVKQPPVGDSDALQAEGIECYRTLVRGLLDITDNIVKGEIVPPERVVRLDEDDPYLVVAADKGTATFSDIANALSLERHFWLGDAFASGGSEGYDHKKMGITARGAWESVKFHFATLGVNTGTTDFTVAGI
ncbi:MAG TPA: NAD-glutamate dehydrogenase domain-containing protein, partial [Acidimicrobiales bacterium]|nr:NAD-glutamate dehydrogenase domain-containing protein [Acidimicrobiales bacterium]